MKDALLMRRAPAPIGAPYRDCLVPADDAAAEAIGKIPIGEAVLIQTKRGRSLQQHRLFWGLLSYVAEASEWETAERLLVAIKVRLGRYDLVKMPNGKCVPAPHSISFSAMKQDEFADFFNQAVDVICQDVLPSMDSAQLIAEAQSALGIRATEAA